MKKKSFLLGAIISQVVKWFSDKKKAKTNYSRIND